MFVKLFCTNYVIIKKLRSMPTLIIIRNCWGKCLQSLIVGSGVFDENNCYTVLLLFTKLETAELYPLLATVIFIGNYTSRELVVEFVTDKK